MGRNTSEGEELLKLKNSVGTRTNSYDLPMNKLKWKLENDEILKGPIEEGVANQITSFKVEIAKRM